MKKLYLCGFISIFFILAACNNNDENALDPNNDTDVITYSVSTQTPSDKGPNTEPLRYSTDRGSQPIVEDGSRTPQGQRQDTTPPRQFQPSDELSEFEATVIELTNEERRKAGVPPLKASNTLSSVAGKKSQDMYAGKRLFFPHKSNVRIAF